ncbi:hypothetical protein EXN66_Car004636 [Channa argus]|uniref:Uncharacterized protein n=1 Tax=Channa argus TaxID=215402 RepID=A0A6G1PFQ5_CHAAH|nr:hypothetical protein EXN66_Car004636 [Channa argus]
MMCTVGMLHQDYSVIHFIPPFSLWRYQVRGGSKSNRLIVVTSKTVQRHY